MWFAEDAPPLPQSAYIRDVDNGQIPSDTKVRFKFPP